MLKKAVNIQLVEKDDKLKLVCCYNKEQVITSTINMIELDFDKHIALIHTLNSVYCVYKENDFNTIDKLCYDSDKLGLCHIGVLVSSIGMTERLV